VQYVLIKIVKRYIAVIAADIEVLVCRVRSAVADQMIKASAIASGIISGQA
jgi:hypothetical protein